MRCILCMGPNETVLFISCSMSRVHHTVFNPEESYCCICCTVIGSET